MVVVTQFRQDLQALSLLIKVLVLLLVCHFLKVLSEMQSMKATGKQKIDKVTTELCSENVNKGKESTRGA